MFPGFGLRDARRITTGVWYTLGFTWQRPFSAIVGAVVAAVKQIWESPKMGGP